MATKTTLKSLEILINEMAEKIAVLEARPTRDRGPASERQMTEDDARSIIMGEHVGLSHKAAAEALGLSYGQVYSARNGFTFKKVNKEFRDSQPAE